MDNQLVKKEETTVATVSNITDEVLLKVQKFEKNGQIYFPENYSPENALKSAWLTLQDIKDKNGNLALKTCNKNSIANALLNMVIQGLNPAKNQCYFIPYGTNLTLMRSYFGSIAVAKSFGEIQDITAEVVYEGDILKTKIVHGKTIILEHIRENYFANANENKIIGAYATIIYKKGAIDGLDEESLIMALDKIHASWKKSKLNPEGANSTHKLFPEDMCKRTVINKICKYYINTKDDSNLNLIKEAYETSDEELKETQVDYEITNNANQNVIDVEPVNQEVADDNVPPQTAPSKEENVEPATTNTDERPSF